MSTTFGGVDTPVEVDPKAAEATGANAAAAADFKKVRLLIFSSDTEGPALRLHVCTPFRYDEEPN